MTFDHNRIADNETIIGDIAYDDRTSGNNATFTHSDTGQMVTLLPSQVSSSMATRQEVSLGSRRST